MGMWMKYHQLGLCMSVVTVLVGCAQNPSGGNSRAGAGVAEQPTEQVAPGDNGTEDAGGNPEIVAGVEDVQGATWLVMASDEDTLFVTATAFAVGSKRLATNAHVIDGIRQAAAGSAVTTVAMQHETGMTRNITTVWQHPDYRSDVPIGTPDVGLLEVDETLPSFLPLADEAVLHTLSVLQEVSLCGFPADVTLGVDLAGGAMSGFRPRATCLSGTISALRPFDADDAATADNTRLIQYDLPVASGTSGSPVFNHDGEVIGINAAGFEGQGDFNFAIRIDELAELMVLADDGTVPGTPLDETDLAGFGPCNTSYYNAEWRFGFDLPDSYDDVIDDDDGDDVFFIMTGSSWYPGVFVLVLSEPDPCGQGIQDCAEDIMSTQHNFVNLREELFVTSNGRQGVLFVWDNYVFPGSGVRSFTSRSDGRVFELTGVVHNVLLVDDVLPELESMVRSICTD